MHSMMNYTLVHVHSIICFSFRSQFVYEILVFHIFFESMNHIHSTYLSQLFF